MPRNPNPPPDDLDKDSQALWKKTLKQLQDASLWEDSDTELLARYIRALERARYARDELRDPTGLVLTAMGSQGQLVQHPNVKTAREAERDAHEYAKELLLTPKAREQHELEKKRVQEGGKFGGAFGD